MLRSKEDLKDLIETQCGSLHHFCVSADCNYQNLLLYLKTPATARDSDYETSLIQRVAEHSAVFDSYQALFFEGKKEILNGEGLKSVAKDKFGTVTAFIEALKKRAKQDSLSEKAFNRSRADELFRLSGKELLQILIVDKHVAKSLISAGHRLKVFLQVLELVPESDVSLPLSSPP